MSVIITTLDSRHDCDEWLCLDLASILTMSTVEIEGIERHLRLKEHAKGCLLGLRDLHTDFRISRLLIGSSSM